jgi:hypothetical protein
MKTDEHLIASRAIHIELERLSERLMELARFRCAEPSNQAFLNLMARQAELLQTLGELHDKISADFKSSSRAPLV